MSSGAIDDPSTTTTTFSQPPQHYFCYQCNRTVSLSPSSSSSDELACPHCNGGFLEESYLQTMRAGGANIQFVIENANPEQGGGGGNFRLPSNLGDYFFGPGLEQLIQQLAENDPNRYGTPPASKTAVEGLPIVKVTEELLLSDSSQCAVCMDEFQLGAEAKQMPCKHVFHSDCILPWLELHNSCPNDRTVERSFNISLPWPFRNVGSSAEGSNASGDGNEANPRRRGNPDFGSETRTEDLD
uniref:RING-type E3 ubiquitin transferase n=1 Tax=Chenopodium quinoa TaxID=63459 RepID=A0A803N594_CHEQI